MSSPGSVRAIPYRSDIAAAVCCSAFDVQSAEHCRAFSIFSSTVARLRYTRLTSGKGTP